MNISLPTLVLMVPEDDAAWTSRPGIKETQLRQRIKGEKNIPQSEEDML